MAVIRSERGNGASKRPDPACVEIGLVNNMPDTALEATERQFLALLGAAAGSDIEVRLTFYAVSEIPRADWGLEHVGAYEPVEALEGRRLDGLIVTGTEPRASNLKEEPYWAALTRLMEWAEQSSSSSIWSCLAAHAAVLHIDGIERRPLADKRFGVFDGVTADTHHLTDRCANGIRMPHSRWNDLPEDRLRALRYRILTRSGAGVDAFAKRRRSLFVFLQGHPEYEGDTLLREYRRDIARFLKRERDTYPGMPCGYFDEPDIGVWSRFRARALEARREETMEDCPDPAAPGNTWRRFAAGFYRNWLMHLAAERMRRAKHASRIYAAS